MQAVVVPNTYSVDSCRHGVGGYKRLDGFWTCPHLSSRKFQNHPAGPTGRLIELAPSWCGSEVLGKRKRRAVRCRWELNPGKSSIQDGSYGCRWMGSRCRQRAP